MQLSCRVASVLALVLHPAFALSTGVATERKAAAWLRARNGAPQPDELAELRDVNPEAYGLVKALLTKRSLGLLDPKHPSASFAAPPGGQSEDAPSGPAAFAKIAEESGEKPKVAPLYPDVPSAPVHHDWLNWKPQQSSLDDDAMVKNVLGAVAEMKAESPAQQESAAPVVQTVEVPPAEMEAGSPAQQESAAPVVQTVEVLPEPVTQKDAKPAATMNQENSYLKGIDFGMGEQPAHPRSTAQDNSYLHGMSLENEEPPSHPRPVGLSAVGTSSSSVNYLASFSWDDEKPAAKATVAPTSSEQEADMQTSQDEKPAAPKKNALLAWLEPEQQRTATKAAAPASIQQSFVEQGNSYLKDLDLN